MRQVLVRFAGVVVPDVRRRAQVFGQRVRPRQSRTTVYRGFIIVAKGQVDRVIVNVVELPPSIEGVPQHIVGVDAGAIGLGYTNRLELMQPKPRESQSTGYWASARYYSASYEDEQYADTDLLIPLSTEFVELYTAGDIRMTSDERTVFCATVCKNQLTRGTESAWIVEHSLPWRASTVANEDSLRIFIRGTRVGDVRIGLTSRYLSSLYGGPVRFAGLPNRLRQFDTPSSAAPGGGPFYYAGKPTPPPLWMRYREGDGYVTENPRPFRYTCEAPGARPQHCFPAADRVGGVSVVAFPCVSTPDGFDILDLEGTDLYARDDPGEPEAHNRGNISASSLAWGHNGAQRGSDWPVLGYSGFAWDAIGFGSPMLCVLGILHADPLTEGEVSGWVPAGTEYVPLISWQAAPRFRAGERCVNATRLRATQIDGGNWQIEYELLTDRVVADATLFPGIKGSVFLELQDLPAWIQPGLLREAHQQLDQTERPENIDRVNPLQVVVHSDQRLSCVFGDPKITIVDGVAEVLFSVKSRDFSLVSPVTPRPDDDPQLAFVCQTKVALVSARYSVSEEGEVAPVGSPELWFQDLIGPVRSDLMPAGADPDTARIPCVIWSGVMDGQRVYLCRAVRYVRDEYLGSMEQVERGRNFSREELDALGWPNLPPTRYAKSHFEESATYRPMVDKVELEELWVVVDGQRTIVSLPDGGLLYPALFEGLNAYYFGSNRRARCGYYGPEKEIWLTTAAEESDPAMHAALGRMHEEPVGFGAVINTVARISETDVIVLLHPPYAGAVFAFMRLNCLTGAHEVVSSVTPGADLTTYTLQSLSCYQWEITSDDEVVQDACLMWRSGRASQSQVHFSVDGARSWAGNVARAGKGPNTLTGQFGMGAFNDVGVAGLGLYVEGASIQDQVSPLFNWSRDE